ncbi:MAG: hypothetical protein ACRDL6_06115 [Solirubrobacterales bacterium]
MKKANLQALLAIGGIGAALILVGLLGTGVAFAGVGLMALATVLTAQAAPEPGAEGLNWWALLAGGTALALIGVPLSIPLEALGGLVAATGSGLAIVGVVFGMP